MVLSIIHQSILSVLTISNYKSLKGTKESKAIVDLFYWCYWTVQSRAIHLTVFGDLKDIDVMVPFADFVNHCAPAPHVH